jgi:fatty acid synthase
MGTQWPGMGRSLMQIERFRQSIERSSIVLEKYGINLCELILSSSLVDRDTTLNIIVMIVAIQTALVDCLNSLGVKPDGIIGHSIGELGMICEKNFP